MTVDAVENRWNLHRIKQFDYSRRHVDDMWGMRVVQIPARRRHRDRRDKLWKRVGRSVQFRRLSNATWILATRCANDGSSFIIADDALEAVDDGRVIAAAERRSDLDELHPEQLAHQVHRDLSRDGEILRARLGAQPFVGDAPLLRHGLLDREGVERRTAGRSARPSP